MHSPSTMRRPLVVRKDKKMKETFLRMNKGAKECENSVARS